MSPAIRDGSDRRVLKTIALQVVTAAIWRRRLPAQLESWLALQKPARMLQLGLVARPRILLDELTQAADAAGIADGRGRQLFLTDVCELARDFAGIVKADSIEVRLSVVREEAFRSAQGMASGGIRMLTIYQAADVGRLRRAGPASACRWRILCGGTLLRLGPAWVAAIKDQPADTIANRVAAAPAATVGGSRSSGLLYLLELRP